MERAPNPCEAGATPHIAARCVSGFSGVAPALPLFVECSVQFSGFQTFLLFQRHIFPV
jgi:hypothetical protein